MNSLQEIAEAVRSVKSATIFTHTRPDGDTLGSALALYYALKKLNIAVEVVNDSPIPDKFLFIPAMCEIKQAPTFEAEAYIAVDSSDENRLGTLSDLFLAGKRKKLTVNIDHHISNTMYAKYNYMVTKCANCVNMANFIPLLGVEIDKDIADALMMGILTDSGNFSHNDVDGETFRIAGDLSDKGANVEGINYFMFKLQTKARALLYGLTMSSIRYLLGDKLAVTVITHEMLEKTGAEKSDTEGFVDFPLNVDVVEVSATLLENRKGQYKISLRSKGKANVNEVAATFGGGGHIRASGCMLSGDLEEVIDRLRFAVSRQF